jgi:predicted MFS family arabinose efflux permease
VSKTRDPVDMSFCKRPGFIIYMLSNAMYIAGYYIPIGLLPETASSTGVSLDDISLTFSLSGLIQILGRLVFGLISHRCPSHITKLWIIYLVAMGLTMLIIPFSTTLYHYLIFNLFGGFFIGMLSNFISKLTYI